MATNNPLFSKIEEIKKCINGYEFRKLICEALTISAQGMTDALVAKITEAQTALNNLQQAIDSAELGSDALSTAAKTIRGAINELNDSKLDKAAIGTTYKLTFATYTVNAAPTTGGETSVQISNAVSLPPGTYQIIPSGSFLGPSFSANFVLKGSGTTLATSASRIGITGVFETGVTKTVSVYCNNWSASAIKFDGSSGSAANYKDGNYYYWEIVRLK